MSEWEKDEVSIDSSGRSFFTSLHCSISLFCILDLWKTNFIVLLFDFAPLSRSICVSLFYLRGGQIHIHIWQNCFCHGDFITFDLSHFMRSFISLCVCVCECVRKRFLNAMQMWNSIKIDCLVRRKFRPFLGKTLIYTVIFLYYYDNERILFKIQSVLERFIMEFYLSECKVAHYFHYSQRH